MVWADICLSIFDVGKARVGNGVAVAETILVGEFVHDFVEIPALAQYFGGLPAHVVELARLWRVFICGIWLGEKQRPENTQF
jgi:hypothetical protein